MAAFMSMPEPSPEARAHSARVVSHIRDAIATAGGWIDFARYMELALYAPGLGYYSAGARKLGRDGDFTTAPEMTPLFGATLARPIGDQIGAGLTDVLEIGAGSGALAASVLAALEKDGKLPASYQILELSADLRERSRDTLAREVPHLLERITWLNRLPPAFEGVVIGNEVLDAMPVELVRLDAGGIDSLGVACAGEGFTWSARPASGARLDAARALDLPDAQLPYTTEFGFVARGFIAALGAMLRRGVAIFIDYGFPAREYYHPDRAGGTLRCHYRHRAHDDPFYLPGLQDITAHVDFTAIAEAADAAGLDIAGYTSQANFLIECGITELLAAIPVGDTARYLPVANVVQRLVSPAEMGELFKVIALTRGLSPGPLRGFGRGDRRAAL